METENINSTNENGEHENSSSDDGEHEQPETYLNLKKNEDEVNKERIFLTSRRTKKHVTIHEDSPFNPQTLGDVNNAVDNLEKYFATGIDELRHSLKVIASDRKTFELHIKSLEESLRKSTEEKENYKEIVNRMKGEMENLASKLDAMERFNEDLQGRNETLQSDHEDHMISIAERHRRNRLAKKTFTKWKGKLKKKDLPNSQVEQLLQENENLKKELLHYQESTKNAFLRSANVLNSEAISLFQNTTSRFVRIPSPYNDSDGNEDSSTDTSSASDRNSIASVNDFIPPSKEKENGLKFGRGDKEHLEKFSKENVKKNISAYHPNEIPHNSRRKFHRNTENSHSDNEIQNFRYKGIGDHDPDPLRREARQIMKQLEINKPLNVEKDKSCMANQHLHICHCVSFPGKSGTCPYCYANTNYRFENMAHSVKNKNKDNVKLCHNIRPQNCFKYDTDKGKVLYKPSGSTVVVEKHL